MARLHARKRGKAKSRKPPLEAIRIDASEEKKKEVEALIRDYARKGLSPAQIGQVLKDKHGIGYIKPILGMGLLKFLEQEKLVKQYPPDLLDLMKKAVRMRNHLASNHSDVHNRVKLAHVESKIWRLTKYYRRIGKLPKNWHYDPNEAALIIKA